MYTFNSTIVNKIEFLVNSFEEDVRKYKPLWNLFAWEKIVGPSTERVWIPREDKWYTYKIHPTVERKWRGKHCIGFWIFHFHDQFITDQIIRDITYFIDNRQVIDGELDILVEDPCGPFTYSETQDYIKLTEEYFHVFWRFFPSERQAGYNSETGKHKHKWKYHFPENQETEEMANKQMNFQDSISWTNNLGSGIKKHAALQEEFRKMTIAFSSKYLNRLKKKTIKYDQQFILQQIIDTYEHGLDLKTC